MSEGARRDDAARTVLAVGVPVAARYEDGLPALGALDPLHEAPGHAASMSKVLREFGYVEYRRTSPDSVLGEEIRSAVMSSGSSVLVVHVVAHGALAESGDRGLYVVGSDGSALDDPVSSWISLIESHPGKQRPLTLFILDLCHSGAAATLPWHQEMPTGRRRAWVISATSRKGKAFDYRLSRATTTVLQQYLDGTLRVDPSYRHIPLPTVGHEISRVVAELNAAEGYTQQIEVSRVPFTDHAQVDDLPFFPNPGHHRRVSVLSEVDSGVASLLDETFDPRHFMLRGAGTELLDRGLGQGYFRGRAAEVRTLTGWFNGQGPGFRIVTGKPGVGKSALLGVLVCAAHPTLRTPTQPLWFVLPAKPARNDRLIVVHAPDRTSPLGWGEFLVAGLYLQHVLDLPTERDPDLARQLGLAVPMGLPELLELDLARRTDRPHLRPTLAALAHAKGLGMPERVVAHIAAAFAPSRSGSGPLPHAAVRTALAQARFYLRREIDVDGTTLYRLFHEGLAEHLCADPYGSPGQEQTS
ncbi:hypothetical protein ACFW1M_42395 [Streptomyces inhibens]|uniref:hypothetical protein n=1 Tax=Streptomyces inhibens TaxID=2293571 RepID=UPI0036A4ADF8